MESLPIFSLIAYLLVILTTFWAFIKPKSSKKLPPGPPKLPIIGNIHQLKGASPHRVLRSLARKYGAPFMHLQIGQVSTVVVSNPRLAQEILTTYDHIFSDRPVTTASQILFYKGQDIVWAPRGKYWRQMRKICTLELLSPKRVQTYSYIREEELIRMRMSLELSTGRPVIIREMVVEMVNNVICRATVGDICKDRKILIEVLYDIVKALSAFNLASYFPTMQFLKVILGKKSKWLKRQKQLDTILEDILKEHQNRPSSNNDDQEDLVDVLLRVQKTGHLDLPITKDNIKGVILDMLIAGTSTSAMVLEWAMCELMRNPEMMKKVQAELRDTVKGNTIVEVDIQNMPYLKLVVKETLRLHGSLLLVPRENKVDCQVDGYHIPAKTRLLINSWACGTDPEYWENPESFIPERFEKSSISYLGADYQLIPFGAGRRVCPGANFGLAIIELALATLLYYFNWELPNGLKPDDVDLTEAFMISSLPKHPLQVVPVTMSSLLAD
uniref:costunolide synthase-like n=1 Tax=Erigeron canadensis TaxID=72917 RepID=UPI001CB8F77D|nr:costunolide synthase-like [Erigeron canadensis]